VVLLGGSTVMSCTMSSQKKPTRVVFAGPRVGQPGRGTPCYDSERKGASYVVTSLRTPFGRHRGNGNARGNRVVL